MKAKRRRPGQRRANGLRLDRAVSSDYRSRHVHADREIADALESNYAAAVYELENNIVVGRCPRNEVIAIFNRREIEGAVSVIDCCVDERVARERLVRSGNDVIAPASQFYFPAFRLNVMHPISLGLRG